LGIAMMCKLHAVVQYVILPSATGIVKAVIGPEDVNKLKAIPLSNNTISRIIK
jgi:hypothetical protein